MRADMGVQRVPARIVLATVAMLVTACAIVPFQISPLGRATAAPPIALARCDEVQDVFCLVSFGLEPPDQMVIVLLAFPGLPAELGALVTHDHGTLPYPCEAAKESPAVYYCTGPQLPLGSSIYIEVYVMEHRTLLASGKFVLNAFALPTVPLDGVELPTPSVLMTARPTRTPMFGLTLTSPPPSISARPTQTQTPGASYPHPSL